MSIPQSQNRNETYRPSDASQSYDDLISQERARQQFGAWLDLKLARLECRFAQFQTQRSRKVSLGR